ncbi:MAG: hypothetical protein GC131_08165 [Alphaproteobacteria bacterium]|nr:hypothetical protein [Alphaproteobacteria bacterium]
MKRARNEFAAWQQERFARGQETRAMVDQAAVTAGDRVVDYSAAAATPDEKPGSAPPTELAAGFAAFGDPLVTEAAKPPADAQVEQTAIPDMAKPIPRDRALVVLDGRRALAPFRAQDPQAIGAAEQVAGDKVVAQGHDAPVQGIDITAGSPPPIPEAAEHPTGGLPALVGVPVLKAQLAEPNSDGVSVRVIDADVKVIKGRNLGARLGTFAMDSTPYLRAVLPTMAVSMAVGMGIRTAFHLGALAMLGTTLTSLPALMAVGAVAGVGIALVKHFIFDKRQGNLLAKLGVGALSGAAGGAIGFGIAETLDSVIHHSAQIAVDQVGAQVSGPDVPLHANVAPGDLTGGVNDALPPADLQAGAQGVGPQIDAAAPVDATTSLGAETLAQGASGFSPEALAHINALPEGSVRDALLAGPGTTPDEALRFMAAAKEASFSLINHPAVTASGAEYFTFGSPEDLRAGNSLIDQALQAARDAGVPADNPVLQQLQADKAYILSLNNVGETGVNRFGVAQNISGTGGTPAAPAEGSALWYAAPERSGNAINDFGSRLLRLFGITPAPR